METSDLGFEMSNDLTDYLLNYDDYNSIKRNT